MDLNRMYVILIFFSLLGDAFDAVARYCFYIYGSELVLSVVLGEDKSRVTGSPASKF